MLDCLGKIHIFDLLHKGQSRSPRLTTKAIKHPLGGSDGKRGGLFTVERTSAYQISARSLERNVATDQFFDIGAVKHLLYEIVGKSHSHPSFF